MKTTHIDGLPGLALQGRKGSTGIRGNKVFYITESMEIETGNQKTKITEAGTFEDLVNSTNSDYVNQGATGNLPPIYLDEEAFDNDYILYLSDNTTMLYILTEVVAASSNESSLLMNENSDENEDNDKTEKLMNAWLIDTWTLTTVDVSELDLAVEVEDLNLKYIPWNGQYYSDLAPCIPEGTDSSSNKIHSGHEFSILNPREISAKIESIISDPETGQGQCTCADISGTIYSMETDENGVHKPLSGINVYLRTLDDVINNRDSKEQHTDINAKDSSALTDSSGNFSIYFDPAQNPGVDGYVSILVYDDKQMYLTGNFIVTGNDDNLTNLKLYLYDNAETQQKIYGKNYHPKYDIRKDDENPDNGREPIFYVTDSFNYYNTSKTVSDYSVLSKAKRQRTSSSMEESVYTEPSEESSEDTSNEENTTVGEVTSKVSYETPELSLIPMKLFVIYSSLSSEERSKIRIEAEFCQNDGVKSALMSTCKRDIWDYENEYAKQESTYFIEHPNSPYKPANFLSGSEQYHTAMHPSLEVPAGRTEGISYKLNFDNENLRDFKIIVKDYGEGIYDNKFLTMKALPFNEGNYTMYLYLYYKNSPADISKTLLTT